MEVPAAPSFTHLLIRSENHQQLEKWHLIRRIRESRLDMFCLYNGSDRWDEVVRNVAFWFREVLHPSSGTMQRYSEPAFFQCRFGRSVSQMESELDKCTGLTNLRCLFCDFTDILSRIGLRGWIIGGGTSNHQIGTELHTTRLLRTCAVHVSSGVHICGTMLAVYEAAQHTNIWAAKCVEIWTRELMEILHRIHCAWDKFHQVNLNAHKEWKYFFFLHKCPRPQNLASRMQTK